MALRLKGLNFVARVFPRTFVLLKLYPVVAFTKSLVFANPGSPLALFRPNLLRLVLFTRDLAVFLSILGGLGILYP
jgi:hypothetical protein